MTAQEAYILAKAYTKKSIEGAGSLKGAACQIKSIEAITGGHRITFEWEDNDGEVSTDTMDVMDGADGNDGVGISSITYKETDAQGNYVYTVTLTDTNTYDIICPKGAQGETGATGATGNGIASIVKTSTAGLVDTYTITYTNGQTTTFTVTNGESITVDSAMSGSSTNPVQNKVITEALALKQNATDNSLDTEDKTIVGAINEHEGDIDSLKSGLTNLSEEVNGDATTYDYADVITIEDAVPSNLADCSVKIEPVQDLHGYDKPWVGGAGKNKLPSASAATKDNNGITIVCDGNGQYTISGTATSNSTILFDLETTIDIAANTYVAVKNTVASNSAIIMFRNSDSTGGFDIALSSVDYVKEITQTYSGISKIGLYVANGVQLNATINPMVVLSSSDATTFAPYTNICPISGHTEVDVQRDGKNLLNIADCSFENGTVTVKDGLVKINGTFSAKTILIGSYVNIAELNDFYGKELTFSKTDVKGNMEANPIFFTAEGRWDYWHMSNSTNSKTITLDMTLSNLVLYLNGTLDVEFYLQVELGSTATPYEPYAGKTYTIALGDTVYGGTVDFDSGVMTVDRAAVEYDGSEDEEWTAAGGSASGWAYSVPVSNIYTYIDNLNIHLYKSNLFKFVTSADTWGNYDYFISKNASANNLVIGNKAIGSVNDLRSWLSNNHLQVVYLLYTPTTIQLTPQQIQLLKGTNTLTASTGQISVTVNGVAGSIGAVQEQVNDHEERIEAVESGLVNVNTALDVPDGTGKNKLTYLKENTFENRGVTITMQNDGRLNFNGLCTSTGFLYSVFYQDEDDVMDTDSYLWVENTGTVPVASAMVNQQGKNVPYSVPANSQVNQVYFELIQGVNYDGTVGAMLERGNTKTTFVKALPTVEHRLDKLEKSVPKAPSSNGTYSLQVTVSGGVPTYSWVSNA